MKDIAIYGAGGFGKEIACLIKRINNEEAIWNFIGFFDDGLEKGIDNNYGPILGGLNEINNWEKSLAIAIAIGNPDIIHKLVKMIVNPQIYYPNIVSPDLIYLDKDSVKLGIGNIISPRCLISCFVEIGDFNILNGYIVIGHDTKIGSYNVFMPSVNISGGVSIGNRNFMGVSSIILQYQKMGNHVRVGAGSVVMRKTQDNSLYIGNPAIKMKF